MQTRSPVKFDIGLLVLRLFIGVRLIIGVVDNILSWGKMIEFSHFLKANNFPAPIFFAVLSVYAQFVCATLIIVGYKLRFAAAILAFNFMVAIVMVHWRHSVEQMTPVLAMFFISLSLAFTGGGKYAIEKGN